MTEDYQKLDEFYRYSEKKEIEKFQRIGRSASQFYDQQQMRAELEQQKEKDMAHGSEDTMRELLLKKDREKGLEIREIQGDGYSQTEFSQKADTLDPRIGGTKIIFDSRLSDATNATEGDQLKAFMRIKADEKKKKQHQMTELEQQKLMLQQMMEREKAERDLHFKQKYGEKERPGQQQESATGFSRSSDNTHRTLRSNPPGNPPAETLDISEDLFEPEDENKQMIPLIQTVERYNIIMSFIEKTCKTDQEK